MSEPAPRSSDRARACAPTSPSPGAPLYPSFDSERGDGDDALERRFKALATWIGELESRVRTTELATADEAAAKELRRALEIVASHDPDRERRLTDRVDVIAERLETLSAALATTASSLVAKNGEIAELQRRLDEEARRTDAIATGRPGGGSDRRDLGRAIAELAARVEAIAEGDAARRRDLEELTSRFRSSDERLGSLTGDLQERLEALVSGAPAPADERLDSLTDRISALELAVGSTTGSYVEAAEVRTQLEGLWMRLASAERELATLSGSQLMVDRIDDVARRLAVLDQTAERAAVAHVPALDTSRSGTELRALGLRPKRAEATEHETRLEFLTHLERLAQRIEQRLGALDAAEAGPDALPEAVGGARVILLHDPER